MKRIDEFEQRLDMLLEEFSDIENSELADCFEYYAGTYTMKSTRDGTS